ncbi:MAG: Gfo/Idh/MocA family protein [Planctomycetaceae bacterium]
MQKTPVSRRSMLHTTAGAAAAAAFGAGFPWTRAGFANVSANDRPRIGCIGLGGMGRGDAHGHRQFGDILALCDVDENQAGRANQDPNIGGGKADVYGDYRKVLERGDIDVVSIVTPDHWHVKIAIEALQAGKHVFCQKPLTLTLEENQLIRNACRKHSDRVFFIGTQQRSDQERFLRAVNMVRKGLIGKLQKITVGINGGDVGGPFKKTEPPKNLNWDMWLGQAPVVEYIEQRCHNNFRWWYEYSGGKFTDWGAHHVDISLWAAGLDQDGTGPVEIDGTDAKHPVPFKDGYPTQDDSYNSSHDFNVIAKFDGGLEMHITSRGDNGILFEGTEGRFFVNRGKITGQPIEEQRDKDQFGPEQLQELYKGKPFEGHKQNFYRCLAEGGLPVSDVYTHVQTMNVCHLAAIAARLGKVIRWDAKAESIVGDEQAAGFFARVPRKGFEIPRV